MRGQGGQTPPKDGCARGPVRCVKAPKFKLKDSAAWLWLPAIAMTVPMGVALIDGAHSPAMATCVAPNGTYSGSFTNTITLNSTCPNVTLDNTVTATNTAANPGGNAVTGGNGTAWTVSNSGSLSASGTGSGINLGITASTLTNTGSGTITSATGAAVVLTGSFSNSGYVRGSTFGVNDSAGTITNSGGTIKATAGTAVYLNGVNNSINNSGAIISNSGGNSAVFLRNVGTLTNTGSINGPVGVRIYNGGVLNNGTAGYIYGISNAVRAHYAAATISNSGTILSSTANAIFLGNGGTVTNYGTIKSTSSAGVNLYQGGIFNNATSDSYVFGGSEGVRSTYAVASISNAGTIKGAGSNGGVLLKANGTVSNTGIITGTTGVGAQIYRGGYLFNSGTASQITGATSGVFMKYDGGSLTNEGVITGGSAFGVYLLRNNGTIASTVSNSGSIGGATTGVFAKYFAPTIANSGTITGGSAIGVYLKQGGAVSNSGTAARITGATFGVKAAGAALTLTNAGLITGGTSASQAGVYLNAGGSINNSGSINGYLGVRAITTAITLTNSGTISGTTATNSAGVTLANGGTITNSGTAALITGKLAGVKITGTIGNVSNAGSITASGGTGVYLAAGGTVTNGTTASSAALISGLTKGVYATTGAATITNFGTISATGGRGIHLTLGGTISNSGTGSRISGTSTAVALYAAGSVTNAGTITAIIEGIYLGAGGTVTNSGTSSAISGSSGVRIKGGAGTLTNAGVITGGTSTSQTGVSLQSGGSIDNSGAISGYFGVKISGTIANLINSGSISGTTATDSIAVTLSNGGTVSNSGTASYILGKKNGVNIAGAAGTVSNEGTIKSTGTTANNSAIYLAAGGSVSNSGTASLISGGLYGVLAASSATITNQGAITGSALYGGIRLDAGGSINNSGTISGFYAVKSSNAIVNLTNSGVINGGTFGYGLLLIGGGSVSNSGTISGGNAVNIFGTGATVNNTGAITASGSKGVWLQDGGGTITNSGTILATGTSSNGIYLLAGGSINNSASTALISGVRYGVRVSATAAATVTNAGTITTTTSSGSGTGIRLANGGAVTNSGSIHGFISGIVVAVGGASASINNSGTITAGNTGVYLNAGSTLTNTGFIDATIYGVVGHGSTVINSGIIKDGAAVAAGIDLKTGTKVTNNTSGSLIGTIGAKIDGTSTLTNYGTITATSPGTDAVLFTGSGGVLIFGTGSKITGAINGGGGTVNHVQLIGSGTLASNLTNFSTGSDLTVASGASWTANGTWTMPTVTNSGTLQPGLPGTPLNVTGNFTQTGTGVLKTLLTSSGSASLLNITGTATLAGSMAITPPASITAGTQKYTIVTASGGVTGTFASVSGGTALLTPALSYDANNAFVTLTQQAVATPPATPPSSTPPPATTTGNSQTDNENAFAKAFDAAFAANPAVFAPILASLNQIKTREDLNEALNQLTGENSTAVANMIVSEVNEFLNQFQQHSQGTMGVTEVDDPWITGFIQSGNFKGNGNASELRETAWGFTAGADHVVSPGFRIGVMGGMGQQRSNTGGGAGSAKVWYEQLAATADYSDGNWYLNGMVGMSFNHGSTMRPISLPGLTATALGHLTSTQVLVSGQAGYGVPLDAKFTLVPFLGVDISVTNQDAYSETGAGALNLTFAGRTINNQRSILGARLKGANVDVLGLPLNTELKMGWAHQFAAVNPAAVAAFASLTGPTFTVTGAPLARDAGIIGLGLSTAVASNASIHLRYDGEFSGISSSNTVSFGLAVDW